MAKKEKCNWIVTVRCVVKKEVYCNDCTIEEARNNPFNYASDEMEIDYLDSEVISVKENK